MKNSEEKNKISEKYNTFNQNNNINANNTKTLVLED